MPKSGGRPRSNGMTLAYRHLLRIALFVLTPAVVVAAAQYALSILHDRLNIDEKDMEKPLPDLPVSRARRTYSNVALTVDARAHLNRLISRLLEEEGDLRDKDAWLGSLEASLDDLGLSTERGGWIAGIKRSRYALKRQHDEEQKRQTELQEMKDKDEFEKAKSRTAKGKSKLRESFVEEPRVKNMPRNVAQSLEQLREHTSKPVYPTPKPSAKHLLLTVSGLQSPDPSENLENMQSAFHCSFKPGEFALPSAVNADEPVILCGLENWDASLWSSDDALQVVGGTFVLHGVTALPQYLAVCRILSLAVYTYLSLLLEQDLLLNSHAELHYPKITIPNLPTFPPIGERASSTPNVNVKDKPRRDTGPGLWSFLSKKTEDLLHRARRGSVDLSSGANRFPRATSLPYGPDGGFLSRRLSMLSTVATRTSQDTQTTTFASLVERLESWKDLLSTSPGVVFYLPDFLVSMVELESKEPGRKPLGDEKAALASLLGWQGKESASQGMVGIPGFVRHQGITVLYSEHIPGTSTLLSSSPIAHGFGELQAPPRLPCWGQRRNWITYRYYQRSSHSHSWDESLGEAILRWCETAEDPCRHPECQFQRGEHDMRWIHNADDSVRMWLACGVCGKQSAKEAMHDGTFLISFAKFFELLAYSPAIHTLSTRLCEHTAFPDKPWSPADTPIPRTRFNIIRMFSYKGRIVTMTLDDVKDVFEVQVPRLQIIRRKATERKPLPSSAFNPNGTLGEAHKVLRREIMRWWQGVSDYMDGLEERFIADHPSTFHKSLPRLPSTDEDSESVSDDLLSTPKAHPLPPPSSPITPSVGTASSSYPFLTSPSPPADPSGTITGSEVDSLQLLAGLRFKFQQTEQELYAELAHTSDKHLNDVRRSFVTAARGATKRLGAWEKKHSPEAHAHMPEPPAVPEPEWWRNGCHAVPGGNVIVREDDWGSIIAFTLSTADYQKELSNMSTTRSTAMPSASPITMVMANRPSLFRTPESFRRFVSGSTPHLPDPDHDDSGWHEPETYSAVISRKEHPREPAALAAIRDVLRQKPSLDSTTSPSLLSQAGASKPSSLDTPRSVRAKPAVEISTLAAGGQVSGMPTAVESAGKILHDLEAISKANPSRTSLTDSRPSSSGFFEATIRRGKASSLMADSDDSTIQESPGSSVVVPPPPLPPKDSAMPKEGEEQNVDIEPPPTPAKSGFTAAFTNSLTSAMRYVLTPGELPRPSPGSAHHGLLSVDVPAIDERPHIKYDWTIGKRLRFSCTVYYAKQFDQLRKRCGVEDLFMKSMARSENWAAEGGKSRSNFWRTTDNRFIIKTLVNAWNVADLQVLIDLGPSYFKYMEATASRPTVLAKLMGFYTVEIRNLENGSTQSKADLLVMENLFYDRNITKTFDLKGIQGRKIKASSGSQSKTLFDGEWIEGQQRALTLVRLHSKVVLQDAIKADCDFLARSNIMDYSLLLGIDEEKKQMVCGLVDTIGSYTFAKTLEYKAKQGLNSSKEVTVVPPLEYQERFVGAMDDYFLACPDKWSRPLDNSFIPSDHRDLPSVL